MRRFEIRALHSLRTLERNALPRPGRASSRLAVYRRARRKKRDRKDDCDAPARGPRRARRTPLRRYPHWKTSRAHRREVSDAPRLFTIRRLVDGLRRDRLVRQTSSEGEGALLGLSGKLMREGNAVRDALRARQRPEILYRRELDRRGFVARGDGRAASARRAMRGDGARVARRGGRRAVPGSGVGVLARRIPLP